MIPAIVTALVAVRDDAVELARVALKSTSARAVAKTIALHDGYHVLVTTRVRELARALHLPFVNRTLRLVQTALWGIEIGKDVELGAGVDFVHTLGIVIGGDAKVGARVRFFGNATVGTAKDNGYPRIGDDVKVGAGARILGPVTIGHGAVIGANAVVLHDVPPFAVATGVPATFRLPKANAEVRESEVAS